MTFQQVFGGATLYPSQQTYLTISFAVDIQLTWPIEQQIAGVDVVADIMDLDATAASLNVNMPDARQVSNGIQSVFVNIGSNSFVIRDNTGGSIITVAGGEAWVAYLTDNTTQAGSWRTFQLGATVSVANASALAGAGIKAITTTLNQQIESNVEASAPFTVVDADRAKCLIFTSGAGVCNLPDPTAVGADWFFMLRNQGSGDLTVTPPSGTIDATSTLVISPQESTFIFTDGTNFFTVGFGQSLASNFDFISIVIPGSGDYILSGAELNRISYRFTGTLTTDSKVVVPDTVQQYWIDNQTTGSFALSVGTSAQVTSPEVTQASSAILSCDSVDVINASESSSITLPLVVAQGGTGASDAATARTNLGAAASSVNITAGTGLSGGGDLTTNRTINVLGTAGGAMVINADDISFSMFALTAPSGGLDFTDNVILEDVSESTPGNRKVTLTVLNAFLNHDNLAAFVADDHVAHTGVTLTAGTGLTGGGDISVNRTFDLDISGLTGMSVAPAASDGFLIDDGGVMKRMSYNQTVIPVVTDANTHTFTTADLGTARAYTGSTSTDAWTVNTSLGQLGQAILVVNNGGTDGPTITAGTATVESASGNFVVQQEGMVVLFQVASNVWKISGDLVA